MTEQMDELKMQVTQLSATNTKIGRGRGFNYYNCGMFGHFPRVCSKQRSTRGVGARWSGSFGFRGRGRGFTRGKDGSSTTTKDFQ